MNSLLSEFGDEGINSHIGLPLYASDDFSQYLSKVPGCMILLNNASTD
jgi:metal-dependent amidase/aminoacylase/carboxypeptidase family protein